MSELQVFSNPEFGAVRSMMIEDAPWFVGRDVAGALGYADPAKAIRVHVDSEDKGVDKTSTPGGTQNATIINESGLYSLILSSKLPSAKRFKRWVTSEVLPALRRTGRYEAPGSGEEATPAEGLPGRTTTRDDYLRAASIVATCRNERLPYVLSYLKQAGIDATGMVEAAAEATPISARPTEQERLDVIRLLVAAHNEGYGDTLLAKMLGASKNDVRRWRVGMVTPRAGRIAYFKEVLEPLVHQDE